MNVMVLHLGKERNLMSVEQINLLALQGLLPTLKFIGVLVLLMVGIWFATLALCAVVEKVKSKIVIKGAR